MSGETSEVKRPAAGKGSWPAAEAAGGGEEPLPGPARRGRPRGKASPGPAGNGGPAALRALMAEAIDYAGLFPPARLDLPAALEEYERHRRSPGCWMLGRFLVPADRLAELAGVAEPGPRPPAEPLRLAVVAGAAEGAAASLGLLRRQAEQVRSFGYHAGARMLVEAVETRLPEGLAASRTAEGLASYLEEAAAALAESTLARLEFFVEIPAGDREAGGLDRTVAEAIQRFRGVLRKDGSLPFLRRLGLKLRCGGASAPVPGARRVASLIAACRDAGVSLKFTAGLHCPLRRPAGPSPAGEHGFLNVLVAAVLAHARGLDASRIAACLAEESPEGFAFQPERLGWQGEWATTPETARARREFVTGFGSCSFEEPRAGLMEMGLLA